MMIIYKAKALFLQPCFGLMLYIVLNVLSCEGCLLVTLTIILLMCVCALHVWVRVRVRLHTYVHACAEVCLCV